MNSFPTESPRLICRIVRWWSALTERAVPVSSGKHATGHRAHCPACRAYFQSVATLESRLRRDARANLQPAPSGLEQRIAAAVRRTQVPAKVPARRPLPLWSAGLVAAAAMVAVVLVLNHGSPPPPDAPGLAPTEIANVVAAIQSLPQHYRESLAPSAARLATADPLGRELDSVAADARSALSFLAANFLPSDQRASLRGLSDRPAAQGG